MSKWTKEMTIGDLYHPAMKITKQAEADAYFEKLVAWSMEQWGKTREEAEQTQKSNLGYFAGYYDSETRERVERLFKCSHPVFGSIAENGAPTMEEALEAGKRMAQAELS
jgi:hypothetical protein